MVEDNPMLKPDILKKAYFSSKSTHSKLMIYTRYILGIFLEYAVYIPVLAIFKFCQLSKKQWML